MTVDAMDSTALYAGHMHHASARLLYRLRAASLGFPGGETSRYRFYGVDVGYTCLGGTEPATPETRQSRGSTRYHKCELSNLDHIDETDSGKSSLFTKCWNMAKAWKTHDYTCCTKTCQNRRINCSQENNSASYIHLPRSSLRGPYGHETPSC